MNGNVVSLLGVESTFRRDVREKLQIVSAVFTAIHEGELLSLLPDCPIARDQHKAAMTLLAVAESEIHSLCDNLAD
jgi:hypothetical protein